MRALHRAVLLLCVSFAYAAPAGAQVPAVSEVEHGLETVLAGHTVRFPFPVWTTDSGEVPVEQARTVYSELEPGVESLVLLPVSENVVVWTRLMGVLAVNQPGYLAETHMASIIEPMQQSCVPGSVKIAEIPAAQEGWHDALLLMCGRYKRGDASRRCAGGIIVAVAVQSPLGAAKVYHEWCTGAFNPENRARWPIPADDLLLSAALLQQYTAFVPLD